MSFLPCPFCGSDDIKTQTQRFNSLTTWYLVKCKNCTCKVHHINPEQAKDAWNRRSSNDGR